MTGYSLSLELYAGIMLFLLGAVFGSFINCLSYRVVRGEDPIRGRSRCVCCGHELSAPDLVPVFSYLVLRGRCRYCKEKIDPRYVVVEILMGLSFLFAFLRFGISTSTLTVCGTAVILMGLSLTDIESYEIPDGFIIALIIWWVLSVLLKVLTGQAWVRYLRDGLIGGVAIAGALLLLSLLFDRITGKDSLGGGDIKLMAALGFLIGWKEILLVMGIGAILGSVIHGLIMLLTKKEHLLAFGPYLSAGGVIVMCVGEKIIEAYMAYVQSALHP